MGPGRLVWAFACRCGRTCEVDATTCETRVTSVRKARATGWDFTSDGLAWCPECKRAAVKPEGRWQP